MPTVTKRDSFGGWWVFIHFITLWTFGMERLLRLSVQALKTRVFNMSYFDLISKTSLQITKHLTLQGDITEMFRELKMNKTLLGLFKYLLNIRSFIQEEKSLQQSCIHFHDVGMCQVSICCLIKIWARCKFLSHTHTFTNNKLFRLAVESVNNATSVRIRVLGFKVQPQHNICSQSHTTLQVHRL